MSCVIKNNYLQIWKQGVDLKILKKQNKLKKYNVIEITIKIQTLDNTYSIKINQLLTISQLKEEISKKYNIPKEKQRLIFQGKFLKDNENLSFYKITEGCVVQLIAKSLEENNSSNNNNTNHQNRHRNHNQRSNEVY